MQEKLTGRKGGIELLCAIGFEPNLKDGLSTVSMDGRSSALADAVVLRDSCRYLENPSFIDIHNHRDHSYTTIEINSSSNTAGSSFDTNSNSPDLVVSAQDMFPLLTPNSLWDLHLEMYEPAIEALTEGVTEEVGGGTDGSSGMPINMAVKLSWLDWFDGLTNHKAAVDAALAAL